LKLVALKIKNPACAGNWSSGRTFESLGYLKFTERVLAHFIRLSKSRPPLSRRMAYRQTQIIGTCPRTVNKQFGRNQWKIEGSKDYGRLVICD
jgi:hypothetical protein